MGKHPKVLLTDQDLGMKAAIEVTFPETVHRLCSWHILNKLPLKIGALADSKDAMCTFHNILWFSQSIEEFETNWNNWIQDYGLSNNKWLNHIYSIRDKWVHIFFANVFCAGMKTTQRSEGMNSFLRSRVTEYNTLLEFVVRYENALKSQRERENNSDHYDSYYI